MKEYIKKFATAAAADNYSITYIPFATSVATNPIQNLVCNQSGMKLVSVGGIIEVQSTGPTIEMVDLGLSVKWAKYNLGATSDSTAESWYGCYYAWGELETKERYDWTTYKFGGNSSGGQTKYNNIDNMRVLNSEDDVCSVIYGSNYKIPSKTELEELIALPNEWVTNYQGITGLNGRVFTGNDNTLFIPAAGGYNTSKTGQGQNGAILSNTLYESSITSAYRILFNSSVIGLRSAGRSTGFSVRAVC